MSDFTEDLVKALANYARSRMTGGRIDAVKDDVMDFAYDEHGWDGDDPDALWEAVKALLTASTPLGRQAQETVANRRPEKIKTAPEWDASHDGASVTAPFRFVPLNTKVSRLDAGETPLNAPLPGNLSAVVDVEWKVETPLLVGETQGGTTTEPFKLGDGYAIPGATLRGALRSVTEIIALGRLFQVNRHARYALRDFDHPEYKVFLERTAKMQAGWLRRDGDVATIEPCEWGFVEIADLIGSDDSGAIKRFATQERGQKYQSRKQNWTSAAAFTVPTNFALKGKTSQNLPIYKPDDGNKHGYFVFSGKMPGGNVNKKYEYVFFDKPAQPVRLDPAVWDRFETTNCKPSQNKRDPVGGWKDLHPLFEQGGKVPVFYVGNLAENGADPAFSFGVTRLYRIPHKNSVGDLLLQSGKNHRPAELVKIGGEDKLQLQPDFVEHLFGYVYEPKDLAFGHSLGTKTADYTPPRDVARKGRVAFDFAYPVDPATFELWPKDGPVTTIMGVPKPSFAPFYLAGTEKDFSADPPPRLAGRKRYLARYQPGSDDAPRDPLLAMLQAQVGDKASDDTKTSLRFLAPKGDARFRGRMTLHNVSEAELGAILWALTFGGDPSARHMLGRGKAFGAGQVAAEKITLHVRRNEAWDTPEPAVTTTRAEAATDLSRWMQAFETEIARLVKLPEGTDWRALPEVAGLLAAARPRGWTAPGTRYLPYTQPGVPGQAKAFAALRGKTGIGVARNLKAKQPPEVLLAAKP